MYYVYAYIDEINNLPYYIGKGKKYRAWSNNHDVNLPIRREFIVIVAQQLSDVGACALERRLIKWYGRKDTGTGILDNKTDGGDGVEGRISKYKNTIKTKDERKLISIGLKKWMSTLSEGERKELFGNNGDKNGFFEKNHKQDTLIHLQNVQHDERTRGVSCLVCKKTTDKPNFAKHHGIHCGKGSKGIRNKKWYTDGTNNFFLDTTDPTISMYNLYAGRILKRNKYG